MAVNKKNTFIAFLSLLAISCGEVTTSPIGNTSDPDNSETTGDTPTESVLLEGVSEIEFDSSNFATLDFDSADKDYLLALFSYDDVDNDFEYQVGSSDSDSRSAILGLTENDAEQATADAHNILRGFEEEINTEAPAARENSRNLRSATTGSTRSFKVLDNLSSSTSYDTITAELRLSNDHFAVYVDERNEEALDDDELEEVFGDFEAYVDDERELFGEESDVNGDGQFVVLLTQAVNELGSSGGGMVTGYFYAIDLYDSGSYPASNEMEIIFTAVPDPEGSYGYPVSKSFALSNILPSVLPHEFQHMISYNQHVFINGGSSERSFLNEGLSHLAEDIYSRDSSGYMAETGIENPARVAYYLDATDSTCFVCGSSLAQRGGTYLLVRYLYEQAELGNLDGAVSGADFISRIMDTALVGVDNLMTAAVNATGDESFKFLMGRFALALYFSDTGMTDDSRYHFSGIAIRSEQNDNRGTWLEGPVVSSPVELPHSDAITSSGISYVSFGEIDLSTVGGNVPLSVSAEMKAGGYLITMESAE